MYNLVTIIQGCTTGIQPFKGCVHLQRILENRPQGCCNHENLYMGMLHDYIVGKLFVVDQKSMKTTKFSLSKALLFM